MYNRDMTFEEYQKKSRETALYWDAGQNLIYPTLGLAGEAGEVAEKIKKLFRNNGGVLDLTDEKKSELKKELGDVLWYVSQLSTELGLSLEDVVSANIEKIFSRLERNKLHSTGDSR